MLFTTEPLKGINTRWEEKYILMLSLAIILLGNYTVYKLWATGRRY